VEFGPLTSSAMSELAVVSMVIQEVVGNAGSHANASSCVVAKGIHPGSIKKPLVCVAPS
jgi:hypothetical protein